MFWSYLGVLRSYSEVFAAIDLCVGWKSLKFHQEMIQNIMAVPDYDQLKALSICHGIAVKPNCLNTVDSKIIVLNPMCLTYRCSHLYVVESQHVRSFADCIEHVYCSYNGVQEFTRSPRRSY
jgi:hypothetical protein